MAIKRNTGWESWGQVLGDRALRKLKGAEELEVTGTGQTAKGEMEEGWGRAVRTGTGMERAASAHGNKS